MMYPLAPRLTRPRRIEWPVVPHHWRVAHDSPLRVALTVPGGFELGGIGRAMLYLTQAWSTMPGAPSWTLIDPRGGARTPTRAPLCLFREVFRLMALQSLGWVDLLHINLAGRSSTVRKLILSEVAHQIGLPTVIHLHDFDYESDFLMRHASMQDRVTRMFQRAHMVLVLGRRDLETVVTCIGCDPWRVATVHNAVPDPGTPALPAGGDRSLDILFLGHLDDRKGVPELLEALDSETLRSHSWRLTMAGGGELSRFREEIHERGLTERVELTGWIPHDEAYRLMRGADIFVLPSHAEGMALSVLEAMAHGKAIITTAVGANGEAVRHRQEALLIPPGSPDALTGALGKLLQDSELRDALGQAARRRYLENFEARTYAERMAELYAIALSNMSRRVPSVQT